MLAILIGLFAAGAPVDVVPAGDGGSSRIVATNASVHEVSLSLGPATGQAANLPSMPGYGTSTLWATCLDGSMAPAPALEARLDHLRTSVSVPALGFEGGAPALWIAAEPDGAAVLSAALKGGGVDRILRRPPAEVPDAFQTMRFAPFLVASAPDLAALSPAQRSAVEQAVAAGSTLVLATGEGGTGADLVRNWVGIGIGDAVHPGPAAQAAVPRSVTVRQLTPSGAAVPRVTADGLALLVEAPWGLGRVRVLAVGLQDLEPGALTAAAFQPAPDALGTLRAWLSAQPPMADDAHLPFRAAVWYVLLALGGLAIASRFAPRIAAAGTLPLLGVALWLPPAGPATRADAARVAVLPVGHGALLVGSLDFAFGAGGGRALAAGVHPVALEDARPRGACLITGAGSNHFMLSVPPAGQERLAFLSWLSKVPVGLDGGTPDGELPGGIDGPLAGARLMRLSAPIELPLADPPPAGRVEAWRVVAPSGEPTAPVVLTAPTSEPPAP